MREYEGIQKNRNEKILFDSKAVSNLTGEYNIVDFIVNVVLEFSLTLKLLCIRSKCVNQTKHLLCALFGLLYDFTPT